jgi:glycerol uptake facilitator-like aquaporin
MRFWAFVGLTALVCGIAFPVVAGERVSLSTAVVLGVLGGALAGAAQYLVWSDRWEETARGWATGSVGQRRRRLRISARETLLGAAAYSFLVVAVLGAVWLADGDRPGAQSLVLFAPGVGLVVSYAFIRRLERKLMGSSR